MIKRLTLPLTLLMLCAVMLGRPLQRTLTATPQKVYEAALALAQQRYMVRDNNQDKMNFKFDISPSLNDEGFVGDVLVEPGVDGQANMTVTIWCKTDRGQNVSACYLGNKRAEKFAKAVEERLAK